MDQNTMMQKMARESFEKGGFNGAWLYAEKGEIVSKGVCGFRSEHKMLDDEELFKIVLDEP